MKDSTVLIKEFQEKMDFFMHFQNWFRHKLFVYTDCDSENKTKGDLFHKSLKQ